LSGLLLLAAFPQAHWQALQVVWDLNEDLDKQELAVCGCTAL